MAKTTAAKRAPGKAVKKGEPVYNRIVLKLSGESFQGPQGFGIHGETIQAIARELKDVVELGVQVAVMVGGGNIFRGARKKGLRSTALRAITWACWRRRLMRWRCKTLWKKRACTRGCRAPSP